MVTSRSDQQERKGYLHALEGVLAALVIVLYLTGFVTIPEPTDWTGVHVTTESEDILTALDDSGTLNTIIMEDDESSLDAIINSLDSSLAYTIQVQDIPRPHISVAVLVNDSQTYTFSTDQGDWGTDQDSSDPDTIYTEWTRTQSDWHTGTFNGTSADRNDNSGTLGIGYLNGTGEDTANGNGNGNGNGDTFTHMIQSQSDWHTGTFDRTSADWTPGSAETVTRSETFEYEDDEPQTWNIPDNIEEVTLSVRGAGGGGADEGTDDGDEEFYGGSGGYVQGTVDVSDINEFDFYVAEGGSGGGINTDGAGGWGRVEGEDGEFDGREGAGGGGMAAVVNPETDEDWMVAGGGGGAAHDERPDWGYGDGGDGADDAVGGTGGDADAGSHNGTDGTAELRNIDADHAAVIPGGGGDGGVGRFDDGEHAQITVEWEEIEQTTPEDTGDLGLGYQEGTAGDDLRGYWRMDTLAQIDDFSRGDLDPYDGETDEFDVVSSPTYTGSYALRATDRSDGIASFEGDGLDHYIEQGDTFRFRFRSSLGPGEGDADIMMAYGIEDDVYEPDNAYSYYVWPYMDAESVILMESDPTGGSSFIYMTDTPLSDYQPGEWWTIEVEWREDDTHVVTVYDEDGTQVGTDSGTPDDVSRSGGSVGWMADVDSGESAYADMAELYSMPDSSGESNHGALRNDLRTVEGVFGTDALEFDGEDDFVDLGTPDTLDFSEEIQITVSAWAKLEELDGNFRILSLGEDWEDVFLAATGDPDKWYFQVPNGGVFGTEVNASEWEHITGVYDGNEIRIYVNGEHVGTDAVSGPIEAYEVSAAIGAMRFADGSTAHEFDGRIDEVRVYDRALTDDEVEDLYFQGERFQYQADDPFQDGSIIGHWRMDDDLGDDDTVEDYSGNLLHGEAEGHHIASGQDGVFGMNGFRFDATFPANRSDNPRISLDDHGDNPAFNQEDGAVSVWVKPEADGTRQIFTFAEDHATDHIMLRIEESDAVSLHHEENGEHQMMVATDPVIERGQWHHITAQQTGSGAEIYVNGEQMDTSYAPQNDTWFADLFPAEDYFDIGGEGAWGNFIEDPGWAVFDGEMSHFKIFDRSLSEDEIHDLYMVGEPYSGEYDSETIEADGMQEWTNVTVDATLPVYDDQPHDRTRADIRFEAQDDAGDTVDIHTVELEDGEHTYPLTVQASEQAQWTITGTSTDVTATHRIHDVETMHQDTDESDGTDEELAGYWRMDRVTGADDGDVRDYSGNERDGVTQNGVNTDAEGVFGTGGFAFDGEDDHVRIDGLVTESNTVTLSAWVRDDGDDRDEREILSIGDYVGLRGVSDWDHPLYAFFWDGDDWRMTNSTTAIDDGEWHHVSYVMDNVNDEQTLYVNGEEVGSSDYTESIAFDGSLGDDTFIGMHGDGGDRYWEGNIDEVMVFDEALDAAEVEELYFHGPDPFQGEYESQVITPGDTTEWNEFYVDATVPDDTDLTATFQAIDGVGTVVDTDTVDVTDGSQNYTLNVENTEQAQWILSGTSTEEEVTWEVDETAVYHQRTEEDGGIPSSEHGYRQGNLTEHAGFGDVPFVLSDTVFNDIKQFTAVNFDLSGNGEFDTGPYETGDRFQCTAGVAGCDGEWYEVGPMNDTLTLYRADFVEGLASRMGETNLDDRDIRFTFETVNPEEERMDRFDAAVVEAPLDTIEQYDSTLETFLGGDNFLLAVTQFTPDEVEDTYLSELGFGYEHEHGLHGSGPDTNRLYSIHGSGNDSYDPNNYYIQTAIQTVNTTSGADYEEATLTLQTEQVTARIHPDDTVTFSTDDFTDIYREGDTVNINGNMYVIADHSPLSLSPVGDQQFTSFNTERVTADYHLTRMDNYMYNTTLYDQDENWTQEFPERDTDEWGEVAESPCESDERDPYKRGSFDINGDTIDFLMVNFDEQGLEHGAENCTDYIEFVYFDMDGEGDFDSPGEGPYQRGDSVTLAGQGFTVIPHVDGSGTTLRAEGPRIVGEIPVSTDIISDRGSAAVVNRKTLGDDDISLLRSLLLTEAGQEYMFTTPRTIGDRSYSYTYTGRTHGETPEYYMIDTIWWYQ